MLTKTVGIVLHTVKYSDTSTIVTAYTQEFGRTSYLVHGRNKKKSNFRAAFFQPFSILEMDVYHTPGKEVQRIKEIQVETPFYSIPYNPVKNAVALFLCEVLYRTLRQTEPDENLFVFLKESLLCLDRCDTSISNFHLVFLIKLARVLGFGPNEDEETTQYFDLMNGVFVSTRPLHTHYLPPDMSVDFASLLHAGYDTMQSIPLSRQKRFKLLESLMDYYRLHIPDFHGVQSLAVLQTLFD